MPRINLPIRVKILLASILMLMLVVGLITASMARLFQTDKTTYMRDLTSVITRNVSQEADALLNTYVSNLRVFMGAARDLTARQTERENLISALFENYTDFVAVTVIREGLPPTLVYDAAALSDAGLSKDDLERFRTDNPLPVDRIREGQVYVRNSTLSEQLPVMTVAIRDPYSQPDELSIVAGTIRLAPLMELVARSSTYDVMMFGTDGMILASDRLEDVVKRRRDDLLLNLATVQSDDSVRSTRDIELRGQEWIAGFSALTGGSVVTSVMIPKTAAYLTARELLRDLVYISIGLFALAVTLALFFSHRLTGPLEVLSNAASKIGRGEFNVSVKQSGNDEIGQLAASFNNMTGALRKRDEDLAHAHHALVHSEKMAAFGQLGAGIAHEVKNPLAGILGYAQLALRKTGADNPVGDKLRIIEKEAKRCTEIIGNLMRFARHDKEDFGPTDVNAVIRDAVSITEHQLTINSNVMTVELAESLPEVHGNSNQLQQVLMNLLINAEQALSDQQGEVSISSRLSESGEVRIDVVDNGPGIPADIQNRIFEPFFTTKPSGKGTGLGMSVAYNIVKEHGGSIFLESRPGEGARFTIILPALASEN